MNKVSEFLKSLNWCLTSVDDAAKTAVSFLNKPGSHIIITTNMEIMGHAMREPQVMEICQKASLHVPDGIGAIKILRKFGMKPDIRITGVDLGPALLSKSPKGTKIFFFGASIGIADQALKNLAIQFPHIGFVGSEHGYDISHTQLIDKINDSGAQILYVALGVPKQEKWIAKNLPLLPNIKIAMGVGGSFDCWADPKRRTPEWIQKIGMEWFHRIMREPFLRVPRFMRTLRNFLPLYFFGK
jgi:N-acetylglucosaminyldiphosphoundecaprenol N-acetyl-beta-D-mannosaminyltransferase